MAMATPQHIMIWERVAAEGWTPPTRTGHSAAVINNKLYIFGGLQSGVPVNTLLCYDLSSRQWTSIDPSGSIPSPRAHHASWVQGSKFFIHSGEGSPIHDGKDANLDEGQRLQEAMAEALMLLNDGVRPRRLCFDELHCYDTESNCWSSVQTRLAPFPRKGHSIVSGLDGNGKPVAILFGGAPPDPKPLSNEVFMLKNDEKLISGKATWTKCAAKGLEPSPRFYHSCAVIEKEEGGQGCLIHIFGGISREGSLLGDSFIFDTGTLTWEAIRASGTPPAPRSGHQAVTITALSGHPSVLIYGGLCQTEGTISFPTTIHVFETETASWSSLDVGHLYPPPRYGHSAILVPELQKFLRDPGGPFVEGRAPGTEPRPPLANAGGNPNAGLLVFGGMNYGYCSSDIWCLDTRWRNKALGVPKEPPRIFTHQESLTETREGGSDSLSLGHAYDLLREEKSRLEHKVRQEQAKLTEAEAAVRTSQEESEQWRHKVTVLEKQLEEESSKLRKALENECMKSIRLEEERDEALRLLAMSNFAARLRLDAELLYREETTKHAAGQIRCKCDISDEPRGPVQKTSSPSEALPPREQLREALHLTDKNPRENEDESDHAVSQDLQLSPADAAAATASSPSRQPVLEDSMPPLHVLPRRHQGEHNRV